MPKPSKYKRPSRQTKSRSKPKRRGPNNKSTKIGGPGKSTMLRDLTPYLSGGAAAIANLISPGTGTAVGKLTNAGMSAFRRITGFGDYDVTANSIMAKPQTTPLFGSNPGNMRIQQKEFIMTLPCKAGGAEYGVFSGKITPTDSTLFPWLSKFAVMFQKFKIHGMVFSYEQKCNKGIANATGNMSAPQIIMAYQANVLDRRLSNVRDCKSTKYTTSDVVMNDLFLPIECAPNDYPIEKLFIKRSGGPQTSFDARFESFGQVVIFTKGGAQTADFNCGELHVTYDIELFDPIYFAAGNSKTYHFDLTGYGEHAGDSVVSTGHYLGSLPGSQLKDVVNSWWDDSITLDVPANAIVFDKSVYGKFLIMLQYSGSNGDSFYITGAGATNGASILSNVLDGGVPGNQAYDTAAGEFVFYMTVDVQGGGIVTLGTTGGVIAVAPERADLFVTTL